MSFTADVKNELIKHYSRSSHCQLAELAAAVLFLGSSQDDCFELTLDDEELAKKYTSVFRKNLGIHTEYMLQSKEAARKRKSFCIKIKDSEGIGKLGSWKLLFQAEAGINAQPLLDTLLKKDCCKRAFLRGAFLSAGMVSDPQKTYHFEIKCNDRETAQIIRQAAQPFGISVRISKRRQKQIAYIKDGVEIVDMLNVIEAHVALMNFENARILREMRGNVNRKVNCETANIEKTVTAAMKQIEDISFIKETIGLEKLEPGLVQIAKIRLEHPDVPLSRLGDLLDPPIGKSGVNHRLRKISQIADTLRDQTASEKS